MNMQTEIVEEIKKQCASCQRLANAGWGFVYKSNQMLYMPDENNRMVRLSIPFVINSADYDKQKVLDAINETNRKVKYVKSVELANGNLAICYDHKISEEGENLPELISHMLRTLEFAASYLKGLLI